jgi:hypothetical protein
LHRKAPPIYIDDRHGGVAYRCGYVR